MLEYWERRIIILEMLISPGKDGRPAWEVNDWIFGRYGCEIGEVTVAYCKKNMPVMLKCPLVCHANRSHCRNIITRFWFLYGIFWTFTFKSQFQEGNLKIKKGDDIVCLQNSIKTYIFWSCHQFEIYIVKRTTCTLFSFVQMFHY